MPPYKLRNSGRAVLLAGVAFACLSTGVLAADKPATPAGAKAITDFVATYAGKVAASPPALFVTPEGTDYAVAFDIGTISAQLNGGQFGYSPAVLKYKVFEQDDGAWRIEQNELPPISGHSSQNGQTVDTVVTATGVHFVTVLDPAVAWIRSGQGTAETIAMEQKGQGLDATGKSGPLKFDSTGKVSADGVGSLEGRESFGAISVKVLVDPKAANPKASPDAQPINVTINADKGEFGLNLDGVKVRPVLDLWAFLVAHPTREALANEEAKLKSLATAALGSQLFLKEEGATPKMTVVAQPGEFGFEGLKAGIVLAATGATSRYEQHLSVAKLALPDGLVPPMFHDLVPTSFDLAVKVTGFDANAAGVEAITDMRLAGTEPPISKADGEKVSAKLMGAGPVVVEISPSHVVAPQLDLAIEGKITYAKGRPTGNVTLRMRNFDQTVTAMKALGPEAEKQMLPALTMAKGLAKTGPDGQLTWVGEVGADGIMKVNGLPLGKAPF